MEQYEIVKVSRNYQVTIPKKIREKLTIHEGDLVAIEYDEGNNTLIVKPYK